jgi:uncharacterized membrane protein YkvA (DUF1232 family)
MEQVISQEQALEELEKGYVKAKKVIKDKEKFDKLIERSERKLKDIPKIGEKLSHIPIFIQMMKYYFTKEYTDVPMGTVIAIVSALLYLVSPVDLIPDFIPGLGYLDDAAVAMACLKLVESDVKEFIQWRDANKNLLVE